MPLIKSKSQKAFGENVGKEEAAGKPKAQSLAIAFSVQKAAKKKKKMAQGGMINEKEGYEAAQKTINPGTPARKADNTAVMKENYANQDWTGKEELDDTSNTKMRPAKADYMADHWAEGGQVLPNSGNERYEAGGMGDDKINEAQRSSKTGAVDDKISPAQKAAWHMLQAEKYQRMAEGGMINNEVSQDAAGNEGYDNVTFPPRKEDDERPSKSAYDGDKWAEGGMINEYEDFSDAEEARDDDKSVVSAIRKSMARGGSVDSNDKEDGQTPYAEMNGTAYQKGEYDPDQLEAQPMDSNEMGDEREKDSENINDSKIAAQIRKSLRAKRGY